MKVSIKYENKDLKKHKDFVDKFINLLQKEYPLKEDLTILFLNGRDGKMSTGSRREDHVIKVLAKGRLNRDIMRTLAHEWVHEFQMSIQKRKHGPDIGGQNEDEANAFAGQLIKKFEKRFPDLEEMMYENTGINGRVNLLTEQILLSEKEIIKENLLFEMKSIGIEKLPYSYSSLKRFIDSKTMDVHYNKHYKGYVSKLNKAIKDKDGDMDLEDIIKSISKFDDKIRNNAGGAFNHALFWKMLSPKKQLPKGEILKKITQDFGNIKKMKDEFNQAAQDRFGSGWAWLYLTKDGKLKIMSTPNQDNPLMNIVRGGGYPLLGLDVWEHAYYLKYQNKRDEYIKKFWDVVNWEFVNDLYVSKTKNKKINESLQVTENINDNQSIIDVLCKKNKSIDLSYCELAIFRDKLYNEELKKSLDESIEQLYSFFNKRYRGNLNLIVELSLKNEHTVNFLHLISEFSKSRQKDIVHKTLRKLLKTKYIDDIDSIDKLDRVLDAIRSYEYLDFEQSLGGDVLAVNATKLKLNYRCGDDPKDTIIKSLVKVKSGQHDLTIDALIDRIAECAIESMDSMPNPLKRDVLSKVDIKNENGDIIIPTGKGVEAKMMDPFIDSYLSEFFAIFKQSKLRGFKEEYLSDYNEVIQGVYEKIKNSQSGENFIKKIKNHMVAMIFEGKYVVPSKYIDLYWSNKGQRGCDEKRLSLRFRIDPTLSQLPGYKFVDTDILVPTTLNVDTINREKVECP